MKSNFLLFFKVVIEGLVETKSWGDIAVDDIKVLDGLGVTDCKGEDFFLLVLQEEFPCSDPAVKLDSPPSTAGLSETVLLCVTALICHVFGTDPDVPTEPMLPEDRINKIRKSPKNKIVTHLIMGINITYYICLGLYFFSKGAMLINIKRRDIILIFMSFYTLSI